MDEQALRGIADSRTLHLGVVEDRKRHREIRLVVHIDVADALVVLQHRDERGLAHCADQPFAAARTRDVDQSHTSDQLADRLVLQDLDQLDSVL